APREQLPHRREVRARVDGDLEERDPEGAVLLERDVVERTETAYRRARRELDLRLVAADLVAPVAQHVEFAHERVGIGEAVPDVGVLGHDPQRLAFTPTADEDRDVARRRRVELRPAVTDAG